MVSRLIKTVNGAALAAGTEVIAYTLFFPAPVLSPGGPRPGGCLLLPGR